jgi:type IV pilus assembly protein PilO
MAINFSLSKLPWYAQLLVFVAIGGGAAGAFWTYYAVPTNEAIATRQATLGQIRTEINRASMTAKRLPEFRKEVATLEMQLDRLRAVLPEQQDVGDLLDRVNTMATQSNLKVVGFLPQAVTKKAMHVEWPLKLQLEGSYHDMGLFLERVSKFPRIINVADIHLRARENQPSRSSVTADVTAMTFVLVEQPKPAAPAPGAPTPGGV